jgi:hypothetical protein
MSLDGVDKTVRGMWLRSGRRWERKPQRPSSGFSKNRKLEPEDILPQKKSREKLSVIRHDRRCGMIERLQFVAVSILPDSNRRGQCLFLRA